MFRECPHGRVRYLCKQCGGKGVCPHGRQKSVCVKCSGGSICSHGKRKTLCLACGGGAVCKHGAQRSRCEVCKRGSAWTMTELPEPGRSGDLKIEPPTTAVVPQASSGMLPSVLQAPLIAQTYSSCPVAYLVRPAASYVPAPISNQALVKLEQTRGSKEPAGGSVRRGLAFDRRGVGGPLQLPVASASGPIAPTPPPLANGDGHLKSVPWWALTTTSSPGARGPYCDADRGRPCCR